MVLLYHLCTQDHAAAAIDRDESGAVFAWKGESLEEYRECTLNALTWPEDDSKGQVLIRESWMVLLYSIRAVLCTIKSLVLG